MHLRNINALIVFAASTLTGTVSGTNNCLAGTYYDGSVCKDCKFSGTSAAGADECTCTAESTVSAFNADCSIKTCATGDIINLDGTACIEQGSCTGVVSQQGSGLEKCCPSIPEDSGIATYKSDCTPRSCTANTFQLSVANSDGEMKCCGHDTNANIATYNFDCTPATCSNSGGISNTDGTACIEQGSCTGVVSQQGSGLEKCCTPASNPITDGVYNDNCENVCPATGKIQLNANENRCCTPASSPIIDGLYNDDCENVCPINTVVISEAGSTKCCPRDDNALDDTSYDFATCKVTACKANYYLPAVGVCTMCKSGEATSTEKATKCSCTDQNKWWEAATNTCKTNPCGANTFFQAAGGTTATQVCPVCAAGKATSAPQATSCNCKDADKVWDATSNTCVKCTDCATTPIKYDVAHSATSRDVLKASLVELSGVPAEDMKIEAFSAESGTALVSLVRDPTGNAKKLEAVTAENLGTKGISSLTKQGTESTSSSTGTSTAERVAVNGILFGLFGHNVLI